MNTNFVLSSTLRRDAPCEGVGTPASPGALGTRSTSQLPFAPFSATLLPRVRMRSQAVGRVLCALGSIFCLSLPAVVMAQAPTASSARVLGSRNLALGHWAYEYIARLRDRGYLDNLNPLIQPYRRIDVAEGLLHLDPDTLRSPIAGWVRTLRREFAPELRRLAGGKVHHWGLITGAGAVASSTRRLYPLRPADSAGVWANGHLGVWAESGPFVAESRLAGDAYWKHDPDGLDPGRGTRPNSRLFRTDNAYMAVDFSFGRFTLGRVRRNWGVDGGTGLMISDNPFPYPQVGFDVYEGRFGLHAFTGQLEPRNGAKRYISAHRVDYSAPNLTLSVGEAVLYADQNLNPSLSFLNPVEFLFFDQEAPPNEGLTPNLVFNAQFWSRLGGVVVHGEGDVDDFDIHPTTIVNGKPNADPGRFAFSLGMHVTSLAPWMTARLEYEQVAAFTYRTRTGKDQWTFLERGLGANYDGYDQLSALVDLYPPIRGLRLTPAAQILRQGQSSIHDAIPRPESVFVVQPTLFVGVKETVYRLGLQGHYQPLQLPDGAVWLDWDVGEDFIRNENHVLGQQRNRFVALGRIEMRFDLPR